MTLLFMDSFDHYTTAAQGSTKWTYFGGNNYTSPGNGRNSTAGCYLNYNSISKSIQNKVTTIIGVAVKVNLNGQFNIGFSSSKPNIYICIETNGMVTVRTTDVWGMAGIIGQSSTTVSTGDWIYLEAKVYSNATVGTVEVRLNGVTVISLTGINTVPYSAGNIYTDLITITPGIGNPGTYIDDVYICDNLGSYNNNFLGDVKIECLFPDSDGDTDQWATSSGISHYSLVNETTPDDDTTYVITSGVGYLDLYNLQNLTTISGSVYGVQLNIYARKDNAGSRIITPTYKEENIIISGMDKSLGNSYTYYIDIRETDIINSSDYFTIDEINNLQIGVRMKS